MVVYNYTKIQRRDKRLYAVFNTTVSQQGLSVAMIKVCAGVLAVFTVIGFIFCMVTHKFWYNPMLLLEGDSGAGYFYIFFLALPIAIGVVLHSYKIQNYRMIDYIKLYLQPKVPKNAFGKRVKVDGYRINSFVERL